MTHERPNPTPLWTRLILASSGLVFFGAAFLVVAMLERSNPTWFVVDILVGVFLLAFAGVRVVRILQHENPAEARAG